jgi:hypothetical protein
MFYKRDPGKCPVDDCEHHTCVAPGTVSTSDRSVVVPARPPRDGPRTPSSTRRLGVEPSPTSFTTATYRRRVYKVGRW